MAQKPVDWSGDRGKELLRLRKEGWSLTRLGNHFGCGEKAIANGLKRVELGLGDIQGLTHSSKSWNEERLTEKWSDYSARKKAERLHNIVPAIDETHFIDQIIEMLWNDYTSIQARF